MKIGDKVKMNVSLEGMDPNMRQFFIAANDRIGTITNIFNDQTDIPPIEITLDKPLPECVAELPEDEQFFLLYENDLEVLHELIAARYEDDNLPDEIKCVDCELNRTELCPMAELKKEMIEQLFLVTGCESRRKAINDSYNEE